MRPSPCCGEMTIDAHIFSKAERTSEALPVSAPRWMSICSDHTRFSPV